jgi:hypothetical protein
MFADELMSSNQAEWYAHFSKLADGLIQGIPEAWQ